MTAHEISKLLKERADPERAAHSARYFRTGPGEYGEGDRFLGIRVPELRALIKKCDSTSLGDIRALLKSPFHEERLFALLLLVRRFTKGDEEEKAAVFNLYLKNISRVNNWDLVDISASHIVGGYLEARDKQLLYRLAKAASIWKRRIAVISTFQFIRNGQFDDSLKLASLLLDDKEDLIHKAVGWMLREIGKRNATIEKAYLRDYYQNMPRTMLRYAIEKFPEQERKKYLEGKVR